MGSERSDHDIVRALLKPGAAIALFLWAYVGEPAAWLEKFGLAPVYTDLEVALYNNVSTPAVPFVVATLTLLVVWIFFPGVSAAYRWLFFSKLQLIPEPLNVRNSMPRNIQLNLPSGEDHTLYRFAQLEVVNGPKYKLGAMGDAENVRVRLDCFDLQWNIIKGVSSCAWLSKIEIFPWVDVRRTTIAAGDSRFFLPFIFRPSVGWCFAPAHDFEGAISLDIHRRMPLDFYATISVITNASWRDTAATYRFTVDTAVIRNGAPRILVSAVTPPPHLAGRYRWLRRIKSWF